MKRTILSFFFFLIVLVGYSQTGIEYTIRNSLDNTRYEIYMRPNVNWNYPLNITGTGQLTIKVPSSANFLVSGLITNTVDHITSIPFPGTGFWSNNARVNGPLEEPTFDYISFGYNSGSFQYPYFPGVEVFLFSFNIPDPCLATIEIVDNFTDPFSPPNSQSANIGNSLVSLGSQTVNNNTGIANAWFANYDPFASCPPLPLDLISFSGRIEDCKSILSWVTANEVNVSHFMVERSEDGVHWENIAAVEAVGVNSNGETVYSFRDENIGFEIYYRLKTVDLDGSFEYSNIIFLKSECLEQNTIHEIFPVPTTDELNFTMVSSYEGDIRFVIIDALGRILFSSNETILMGFNKFTIDTSPLADGVYFLHPIINGNNSLKAERFIKVQN